MSEKTTFKSQIELFNYIWATRPHKSEISGQSLDNVPDYLWLNCFTHILPKGKYPKWKYEAENIMLLLPIEHILVDAGTIDERKAYEEENKCSFQKFYDKKDELRILDRTK